MFKFFKEKIKSWVGKSKKELEEKEFYMDAIEKYKEAYAIEPSPGIAYRIAYCYDKLELEELRDEWNKKIRQEEQL